MRLPLIIPAPTRRRLLAGMAALPMLRASTALADAVGLLVGNNPSSDGAPLVAEMQADNLINQAATELRVSLTLNFLDAAVIEGMIAAMTSGNVQIGMLGSASLIRMLGNANPPVPIALAGGGVNFPLMVTPESPIHDLTALQGATVLALPNSDPLLALVLMLRAQFGTTDLTRLRITLRRAADEAELATAPNGVDAVACTQPLGYSAERKGDLVTLLFNDGMTGAAWKGPEGDGAGHRVHSFAKAPLAPEAYYPHRLWWVVRQDFLRANPDVVLAFLTANARAASTMAAWPIDQIIQVGGAKWAGQTSDQERFVKRILWRRRGWSWITESDARTLVVMSGEKAMFEKAVTASGLLGLLKPTVPLLRRAWIMAGAAPRLDAFSNSEDDDARGPPVWEINRWRL